MLNTEHSGEAFDYWLTKHGQTNKATARILGVSHTTILRFRRGDCLPSMPIAEKIADFMTDVAGILYRIDDVFPAARLQQGTHSFKRKVSA